MDILSKYSNFIALCDSLKLYPDIEFIIPLRNLYSMVCIA